MGFSNLIGQLGCGPQGGVVYDKQAFTEGVPGLGSFVRFRRTFPECLCLVRALTCVREKALLIPAARELEALARLNFSMHSSISAGGAFFRATTARPQNSTSNFLAKAVADSGVS